MFTNGEVYIEISDTNVKIETLYYTYIWYSTDSENRNKIFLGLIKDYI